jgi:probable rRNA maturation factor
VLIVDPTLERISVVQLQRFAGRARKLASVSGRVDILITGDDRLRELNRRFRRKNKATDVLSFPGPDGKGGDIAISSETAAMSASRYGHALEDELKVLILHGMLHLAGYDHERDNGEMAAREHALRARLGLPIALIERTRRMRQTSHCRYTGTWGRTRGKSLNHRGPRGTRREP